MKMLKLALLIAAVVFFFTEQDDFDFPDAPWASIEGGELVGVSFSGFNDSNAYWEIDETFAFSVE